jgi:hypothetical protein
MRRIDTFDNFILTEGQDLINRSSFWPDDWKETPHWKFMELLGFIDTTTTQQLKNRTIKIDGALINSAYPAGLVLQRSGYIRNPLARSGFVKQMNPGFSLIQMFDYIIKRFLPENLKSFTSVGKQNIDPKILDQFEELTQKLDQFFLENPLSISILDKNPGLQQEIIGRTGMKDFRSLQSALKNPIW